MTASPESPQSTATREAAPEPQVPTPSSSRNDYNPTRGLFPVVAVALLLALIVIVAVIGGVMVGYLSSVRLVEQKSQTTITGAIGQIQSAGDLVTLRVPSATWVEHVEESVVGTTFVEGGVTVRSAKVIFLAQGSCLLATDLRNVKVRESDEKTHMMTLVLPQPRVIESSLDSQRSRVLSVDSGRFENFVPQSELQKKALNKTYELAQAKIRQTGESEEMRHMARENTETVLRGLLQHTGWIVKFEWAK